MFKLLKKSTGSFIKRQGYEIHKPTDIETKFAKSYWSQWLSKRPADFIEIYQQNRKFLSGVPSWIDKTALASSYWRYGLPERWTSSYADELDRTGLNDIEKEITSADLLAFISTFLTKRINYLEVGVSVGKNFMQLCHSFNAAEMTGLDVENINPILESFLEEKHTILTSSIAYEIETLSGKKATKTTSLTGYSYHDKNKIFYLSADQFRRDTWEHLKGKRFNFVFSDGVHSPNALIAEMDYLMQFDLIDRDEFVMFWDDMWNSGMQNAFYESASRLCQMFGCSEDHIALYNLHGSYGFARKMGIFHYLPNI